MAGTPSGGGHSSLHGVLPHKLSIKELLRLNLFTKETFRLECFWHRLVSYDVGVCTSSQYSSNSVIAVDKALKERGFANLEQKFLQVAHASAVFCAMRGLPVMMKLAMTAKAKN